MLDRSRSRDRSKAGGAFSPAGLFVTGAQGAWYDPSDYSTLFQNAAGTTPVTAVEQPVRLMLDRSGRGNHATAPNDASRPVLRSRYNLLTRSEEFDNAGWEKYADNTASVSVSANQGNAPNGTTTADLITINRSVDTENAFVYQQLTLVAGSYTGSIYVKANAAGDVGKTIGVWAYNGSNYPHTLVTLSDQWQRVVITNTVSAGPREIVTFGYLANSLSGHTATGEVKFLAWGAQALSAADATATGNAYQRIAAATSYDTSNPVWRPYLAFDGSDDSLSTSAIDFSGTDEMTVFAGVTKLSDAATGTVIDQNGVAGTAAFMLRAPSGATPNYAFFSGGSISFGGASATTYAAPITNVLTGIGDISGDVTTLRVNGAQIATNTSDQGTGNYSNLPIYIGRRQGSSLSFNGRIYGLTVLGRTATAPEISAMEAWVNGKTGAF